jgi:hypothetical protein
MAIQFITGKSIVGLKAETTSGTFAAPIAGDYDVLFHELSPIEFDYGMNRQGKPADGSINMSQSKSGRVTGTFTAKSRLLYTGDENTAPNQAKIWKTAGLVESGGTTVPVVYTFDGSAPCDTLSATATELNCGSSAAGIDCKLRGIQTEMVISAPGVGQEITCDYTFSGAYEAEVDNASPIKVLTGTDTGACEKLLDYTFSIGGQAFTLHNYTLTLGNTVSQVPDPSKNGGVFQYKVTATDCKLACQVQKIDLATSGLPSDIIADTIFNPILITSTNGHWDISITDANLVSRKDADAEGLVAEDLEIEVRAFTLTQKD